MTTNFQNRVYQKCKQIPKGKVSTYKAISNALNSSPRAVGQALKVNPFAPKVPCHRVVASDGSLGGFHGKISGTFIQKKINLLSSEGVKVKENKILNFKSVVLSTI